MDTYNSYNIFISWSGERSRKIAEELSHFLQRVIHTAKPFVSSNDIDKGDLWLSTLADKLSKSSIGIVCLTAENKNKPWILFEAGAIYKGLSKNRVCTLLIDINPNDIKYPLGGFQRTILEHEPDFYALIQTINSSMDFSIQNDVLRDSFNAHYNKFKDKCREIKTSIIESPIDGEGLVEQIDELKRTIVASNNQLPQILEAINIYKNLQNQGVSNVFKCDSNEYKNENVEIIKRIRAAKSIRAFNHIGKKLFENFDRDIIKAINQNNCRVKILIITNDLAGKNVPLLSQLCPETKGSEIEDLKYVQMCVQNIKMEIQPNSTGSIALKRYRFAPTGSILIIDRFVRFIPYLAGRQGDTAIALFGKKVDNGGKVFEEFEEVFEKIWGEHSE